MIHIYNTYLLYTYNIIHHKGIDSRKKNDNIQEVALDNTMSNILQTIYSILAIRN